MRTDTGAVSFAASTQRQEEETQPPQTRPKRSADNISGWVSFLYSGVGLLLS
jgi:hypothetical protein